MDIDNLYETDAFADDWLEYVLAWNEDTVWQKYYDDLAASYEGINEYYQNTLLAQMDYIEEFGTTPPF